MGRDAAVLHNEEQDAVQDQHGRNGDVIVEVIFHPVVQRADDKHRQGGSHHLEPQAPDAGLGNDAAPLHAKGPQLAPEQHHHRHDGTQLDDHPEHGHELFTCIEFDDLLQQDHMTGGRDGEPFGNALHNAHQDRFDDLEKRKKPLLVPKHSAYFVPVYHTMPFCARRMRKFYRKALCRSAGCNCAPKCDILMQRPFVSGFIRRTEQKVNTARIFIRLFYNEVNCMNILVIGCDQVGASLVRDLEHIGHDISLIEKDPEQLKRLDAFDDYRFRGTALVGDPTDPDTLRQGGIDNCDAVAAVSEDDSVNLMAAQIAKSIFRREKVICRVSDPHLQVLYHKAYEIDTICPTVLTEQSVFRALAK